MNNNNLRNYKEINIAKEKNIYAQKKKD